MNILDSKFYAVVDRLSNFFILNMLWLVSCIPIITIAPATSAMFSVVRQWKLHQDTSVVRNYFRYFKENFKPTFIIGIIWIVFAMILYFNFFYISQDKSSLKLVVILPLFIVSLLLMMITVYLFPVIAHYKITWSSAIKSSFLLAIVHFPTTIGILAIFALFAVILHYVPATALIIFSIWSYVNYSLCNRFFMQVELPKDTLEDH